MICHDLSTFWKPLGKKVLFWVKTVYIFLSFKGASKVNFSSNVSTIVCIKVQEWLGAFGKSWCFLNTQTRVRGDSGDFGNERHLVT